MRATKYHKEYLEELIKSSSNWSDACRRASVGPHGGSRKWIKLACEKEGIDYSHFALVTNQDHKIKPIEFYLTENSNKIGSHALKLRLIKEGIKEAKCENCGLLEWLGKPAPLELDHINGNHIDNRLENLRILCSNCHSFTDTNSKKNIKHGKEKYICPRCNSKKSRKAFICRECNLLDLKSKNNLRNEYRQFDNPLEVAEYVSKFGYEAAGRKYGLSGRGVKLRLGRAIMKDSDIKPGPIEIGVEKSGIGPGKAPANPADDLVGAGISYGGETGI